MINLEIECFCEHLKVRNYSRHTIESYRIDLRLFFAITDKSLQQISWREVDRFIEQQHRQGLAPTTINQRLKTIKRFFDYLFEQERLLISPVKPSHYVKEGRPLPKKLSYDQLKRLFAKMQNPMDRALFLLMLRCGLRVSEVVYLKLADIDWEQKALVVEQGKGRKDRRVYVSDDALMSLKECLQIRPPIRPW